MNRADPSALKKAGNQAFGAKRFAEAVEHYTAAIDLWMEPVDRAILYSNRSAARLKLPGEKQKALKDAERACELAPEYAKAHFRRGQALRVLGDPEGAIDAMRHVLTLAPEDGGARQELCELEGALTAPRKPQLAGSLQPGCTVSYKPQPRLDREIGRVRGKMSEDGKAEIVVGDKDIRRVGGLAAPFMDRHDAIKAEHAAKAAALAPPKKAEMFPGVEWPEGYGPEAPGWDPTYTPLLDLGPRNDAAAEAAATADKPTSDGAVATPAGDPPMEGMEAVSVS